MEARVSSPAIGSGDINVTVLIDESRCSRYQVLVIALCGLIALLDGFDLQAMAFVAPVIAAEWGIPIAGFTVIFAAGLAGLTIGSLVFGPIADAFGRRRIIIVAMVIFGAFSILSGLSTSVESLLLYRFLTGLGLGG